MSGNMKKKIMNKKQIEYRKEELKAKIKTEYIPIPKYIRVWFEKENKTLKSLVKFREGDPETYLGVWDIEDLDNIAEICLTDKTYREIYKTTAHHELYTSH